MPVERADFGWDVVDATGWPGGRLEEAVGAAARRPFDLAAEIPLRARRHCAARKKIEPRPTSTVPIRIMVMSDGPVSASDGSLTSRVRYRTTVKPVSASVSVPTATTVCRPLNEVGSSSATETSASQERA